MVALSIRAKRAVGIFGGQSLPAISFWQNWPMMNTTTLQGSLATTLLDPTRHQEIADKDLVIIQGFYPTEIRNTQRIDAIDDIWVINPNVKFFPHVMAAETVKTAVNPPQNSELEIAYDIVNSPTEGRESWYVHRVNQQTSAGRVESQFNPDTRHQLNMGCLVSGLNSLAENYAQVFWRKWGQLWGNPLADIRPYFAGAFQDNFNQRPPEMFQNNGAISITDQDYNGNGAADGRVDYSSGSNAGGRYWAEGHMEFFNQFHIRFPSKLLIPNAARFALDYLDGEGQPPLPLSAAPFYRKFPIFLREHTNLLLGLQVGANSYTFTGGGSVSSFYRTYEIQERFLMLDANNTKTGKSAVMTHANGVNRVATSADYTFARFITALSLLAERAAPSLQLGGSNPLSLDETLLDLGAPTATRTVGTLNESTVSFSLRAPNQVNGAAQFMWATFTGGIAVARVDPPTVGVYPSNDAAVTCTLPTPPAGLKYQRIPPNYSNPVTGRTIRNQDTTLNSGADVTSIAMRPYTGFFARLVPA